MTDTYWHNEWPDELAPKSRNFVEQTRILWSQAKLYKGLKRVPWQEHAETALRKHFEAFRNPDSENAFLSAWRLLEHIGGANWTKGDQLIKRAASFYRENEYLRDIGKHLQFRRNALSHGHAVDADDNEVLAFQMRSFLQPMINHFLTNPYNLASLDEFWEFCDADTRKDVRRRTVYILQSVDKFRRER